MEKGREDTSDPTDSGLIPEAQIEAQIYLQAVLKEIDEQEEETLQHHSSSRGAGGDNEEDALSQGEDEANCDEAVRAIQQEMDQMNNPTAAAATAETARATKAPPVTKSSFVTSVSSPRKVDHMPAERTSSPRRIDATSEQYGGVKGEGNRKSQDPEFRDTIRTGNIRWEAPPVPSDQNINDSGPSNGVGVRDKANGGYDTTDAADIDTSATKPAFFLANEGKATLEKKTPPRYPDSKAMPAKPASMHTRNVSWGMQEVFQDSKTSKPTGTVGTAENIQLPFLSNNLVPPIAERMLFSSANKPKSNGKIAVNDIIHHSPLEAEAETCILHALEERDNLRSRADSSGTRVLDNIPDEAINNLASESQNADINSTAGSNQDFDRQSSNRSTAVSLRLKPSLHRRSETVEQKLAGLSDAIDAFHNMEIDVPDYQMPPSPLGRARLNTYGDAMEELDLDPPLGAAETLQQNASLLFHRGRNKNAAVGIDNGAGAGMGIDNEAISVASSYRPSHWNKLRTVVKSMNAAKTKKNDDVFIVDGEPGMEDEEVGGSPDQAIFVEALGDHEDSEREQAGENQAPKTEKLSNKHIPFFKELEDFFGPRRTPILLYCKVMSVYVFLPVIGVSAVLFHLAGNPPTGILKNGGRPINGTLTNEDGAVVDPGTASASWWLLFIGVRQLITLSLSKATEIFVIDFLSIRSRFTIRLFGPWITLFVLQARGWPFLVCMWAIFDFALLSGTKPFFAHWLYWQDFLKLFNESNPSGNVVDSEWNHRILAIAASVGAAVAVKRFWMGQFLGRQTFSQYAEKLAIVMKKILLISQVASLGRDFEKYVGTLGKNMDAPHVDGLESLLNYSADDASFDGRSSNIDGRSTGRAKPSSERAATEEKARVIDPNDRNPLTGSLNSFQKIRIIQLLGAWEEPLVGAKQTALASVDSILQFRRALSLLQTNYPFSALFGLADTRESCIESAQEVYERLLLRTPNTEVLSFEVLALLGVKKDGSLDHLKLKELVRLFRPDRDGTLSLIDFVKSVDSVYKELRLLRAAVANSSKIDHAFESIINGIFYVMVATIILSQLGFDPLALFLSVSGVVLAFAFMIGSASSKYFEGLLFILIRRPYGIGDGIHVSNTEAETSYTGSAWWTVEDITLFTTSVIFMYTNERATLSNGSLANSRIINSSRSPQAYLYILLKFHIDVPYAKVEIFHAALEKYFRNRPREWLSLVSFRATSVEADRGYIEYIVVGQHREGWTSWGALRLSQAHLATFSLELSKKLDIRFKQPPLPVDLSIMQSGNTVDPASILNPVSGVPGGGGLDQFPGNQANMGYSPDLASLQARFAPVPSDINLPR